MLAQAAPIIIASFLGSCVEFVEAFTIVLVIGVTVNWRSSLAGAGLAVIALGIIVALLGTALIHLVPIDALRLVVGILLVLFGLKWLKKSVMRYAGVKALHDEEAVYEERLAELRASGRGETAKLDPFGVVTSFKSVLLEGLEVAFIVITFGIQFTGGGRISGIGLAALGAAAAFVLVVSLGAAARAPLQRIPENTLKFIVGIMLTSFGTFWGGEGIGIAWWGSDLFLLALVAFYLAVCGGLVFWLRRHGASSVRAALRRERESA